MERTKEEAVKCTDEYLSAHFSVYIGEVEPVTPEDCAHRPIHGLIFFLVLSGEGVIRINEKEYAVKPGTFLSVFPFLLARFVKQTDDFRYAQIAFAFDFMADFPLVLKPYVSESVEKKPCLHLDRETSALFEGYFRNIAHQYSRSEHPSRIEIVKAGLYVLIAEVSYIYSRETAPVSATYNEQVTDDFFKLLHMHYRKERKPEFYAEKLNLSPRYLSQIVKRVTGHTVYFWVCEFVVKEAKIMLQSRELSVSQVSDELNFPNSSYFARYFRKYTGMSPLEYREQSFYRS